GFKARHLQCLGFLSGDDLEAFGFIDPRDIIHASHIVPAYYYGQTQDILPPSIFILFEIKQRLSSDFVIRFFDHDMFKHYCGDGIGHKNTQEHTTNLWHELL
ncbi:hypothetical protein EDD18DRAFT_1015208, partial [Armillaria luteobubalina]